MPITIAKIAELCGVSRGTVDRVVNGRPNVAPEVRERVQKIIKEMCVRRSVSGSNGSQRNRDIDPIAQDVRWYARAIPSESV